MRCGKISDNKVRKHFARLKPFLHLFCRQHNEPGTNGICVISACRFNVRKKMNVINENTIHTVLLFISSFVNKSYRSIHLNSLDVSTVFQQRACVVIRLFTVERSVS